MRRYLLAAHHTAAAVGLALLGLEAFGIMRPHDAPAAYFALWLILLHAWSQAKSAASCCKRRQSYVAPALLPTRRASFVLTAQNWN